MATWNSLRSSSRGERTHTVYALCTKQFDKLRNVFSRKSKNSVQRIVVTFFLINEVFD